MSSLDTAIRKGFDQATEGHGVKVVAEGETFYNPANALKAAQTMLQAQPDMNVIVGADQGATGAQQALNGKKVTLIGYGGGGVGLKAVGSGAWFGTVMQRPATEGKLGMQCVDQGGQDRQGLRRHRRAREPAERRRRHEGERLEVQGGVAGIESLPVSEATERPYLELLDVAKHFGGVQALEGVSLAVRRGSVHALVGENGAGKSTLGRIVAGALAPDGGPDAARRQRGRVPLAARGARAQGRGDRAGAVGRPAADRRAERLPRRRAARRGVRPQPAARPRVRRARRVGGLRPAGAIPAGRLRTAEQQKVEILRALSRDAQLIVMDEPTAALGADETRHLHEIVRRLAAGGDDDHPHLALPRARCSSSPTRSPCCATAGS